MRRQGYVNPYRFAHSGYNHQQAPRTAVAARNPLFLIVCAATAMVLTMLLLLIVGLGRQGGIVISGDQPLTISLFDGAFGKGAALSRAQKLQQEKLASSIHYVKSLIEENSRVGQSSELAYTIVNESYRASYDPLFVTSIIKSESSFRRNARSSVGALGLMQIRPSTGKYVAGFSDVSWSGSHKLREPSYNIKLGIAYLRYLEEMFAGNRYHVLVAYNWGPTNLKRALKNGTRIPAGPDRYAKTILANHSSWEDSFEGKQRQYRFFDFKSLLS